MSWLRRFRTLGLVVLLAPLCTRDARAGDGEGGTRPATFRELLGDLAEEADEVATLYPVAAPAPRWVDDLVDLSGRERLDDADRERARRVIEALRAYAAADRPERLGRQAAHNVAMDPEYGPYVHATLWNPPFLVVATDGSRLTDLDYLTLRERSAPEASALRAHVREKQSSWLPILRRHAAVASAVHAQVMGRFGAAASLRPLSDPWGGAANVPEPLRSFEDGVPLVLFVFESAKAFAGHHVARGDSPRAHHPAYFEPPTGWAITRAEGTDGEQARRAAFVVATQLVHWFSRQRRRWKHPPVAQDVLRIGFATWLAGWVVDADGRLRFTGVDPDLLEEARALRDALAAEGRPYPTVALRTLFREDLAKTTAGVMRESGSDPERATRLVWQHAWAFVLFLHESGDARRAAFERLFDGVLASRSPAESFAAAFSEGERPALEAEFHGFLTEDLLPRDPARYRESPPSR